MIGSKKTSPERRKFFGMLALGAAAFIGAAKNPLALVAGARNRRRSDGTPVVTITPNPLAVERTRKGAAHHG